MKLIAEPMRYHGPGWNITVGDDLFQCWAPQSEPMPGSLHPARDFWQVAWNDENGINGDCQRGAVLDMALKALESYPDRKVADAVRATFLRCRTGWIET